MSEKDKVEDTKFEEPKSPDSENKSLDKEVNTSLKNLPDINPPEPPSIMDYLNKGVNIGDVNIKINKEGACFEVDERDIACLQPWVLEKGKYIGGKFIIHFK